MSKRVLEVVKSPVFGLMGWSPVRLWPPALPSSSLFVHV